jgi:hypothetical protein
MGFPLMLSKFPDAPITAMERGLRKYFKSLIASSMIHLQLSRNTRGLRYRWPPPEAKATRTPPVNMSAGYH